MARPSKFCDSLIERAKECCERGATDMELADALGVHPATLYRWKLEHPEFCEAIKSGKDVADERIERSLFQKASGYDVVETQAVKVRVAQYGEKVEVVEVRRHVPADTTAQIFWLKNRRSAAWRDKQEVEHSGNADWVEHLTAARSRAQSDQRDTIQ